MNRKKYHKFYIFSLVGVILASFYPIYMGVFVSSFTLWKNDKMAIWFPAVVSVLTTLFMYIGYAFFRRHYGADL